MQVHNPGNTFKITEIWAYVSADEGGEGIIGQHINGMMMPFVCADKTRKDQLLPYAQEIQKQSGVKVKLMHFKLDSVQEDI